MTDALPAFEVLPRDLQPYRRGNVGIDFVHRFESGRPGPHVLVNALTHGNEFCGMVAATQLLDSGVRPKVVPAQQRFELLQTWVIQTPGFRFVRPLIGFESFAEGELIATDGEHEIRALCPDCTVLMPARVPIVGREGVYLTRPL
ncbi:MAG: hypothetical protein RJA10_3331 [Pseudomonadota bacterium]|jgi:hypothetical protein